MEFSRLNEGVANAICTERLTLSRLDLHDAPFVLRLVNDPDWLRFIGDRGIHTLIEAQNYIRNGPQTMYDRFGHGLMLVRQRANGTPMGMCGLLKRDVLDHADLGYAFLPEFRGQGYAYEAAAATLDDAQCRLALDRVLAIVSPDNTESIRLLERLGLHYERPIRLDESSPSAWLYAGDLVGPTRIAIKAS